MDLAFLSTTFWRLMGALPLTLEVWALSVAIGCVIAMGLTWMRVSGSKILEAISRAYVFVFRGSPLLIQLFLAYFGLGLFGINVSPWVAAGGALTLYASAYAAYDALSQGMKDFLEPLSAVHDGAKLFDKVNDKVYPSAVHPVIIRHPETGRKLLYVNAGFTTRIVELARDESDAVLNFLYAHIAKPHWQMRFRWRPHSLAFWDNRCTQHFAIWDYWPNVRSGYRVQFEGVARPAR